jgi:hypothetical protein
MLEFISEFIMAANAFDVIWLVVVFYWIGVVVAFGLGVVIWVRSVGATSEAFVKAVGLAAYSWGAIARIIILSVRGKLC